MDVTSNGHMKATICLSIWLEDY